MKKPFIFLLFTVLLFEKYANTQTCEVDSVIELKTKKIIDSAVSSNAQLVCQDAKTRGSTVSCPSGFLPTSCSCRGCDYWSIRQNSECYCKCSRVEWTSARCCKISVLTDGS